jgi:hydroxymethylbilane synthase
MPTRCATCSSWTSNPVPPTHEGPWRIATRRSALAQAQARMVADALHAATGRPAALVPLATTGDEHPDRAIEAFDVKGVFVDRTRQAVLAGDCHAVVHSYKDLPTGAEPGLTIGAVLARADPRDALVSRPGWRLADLPRDRQVTLGTSSARRRAQLQHHRRDLLVQPLRGNLTTRLQRVADGELDAVVVALAGLLRLRPDVGGLVAVPLEHGEMLHAPGQGALAVECRSDDAATIASLSLLDDLTTRTEVAAERALLAALEGGCTAPIGAHAEVRRTADGAERLVLLGLVADPNGTRVARASHETGVDAPATLGRTMAATLRAQAGDALLRPRPEQESDRRPGPAVQDRPLTGRRVLIGRARRQGEELAARVRALGGEPVLAPLLVIAPGDTARLREAARELADGSYAALCLTSPNGVDALADALAAESIEAHAARPELVACVGPGTASALVDRLGLEPDLVPATATTRALAEAFPSGSGRVLLPRADIANPVLGEVLGAKGWTPVEVTAYVTTAPDALADDVLADLEAGRVDLLAFGSSSTARNFASLVAGRAWRGTVVSIGPVTSATCAEHGIDVTEEADPHDLEGLVEALVRAARGNP